MHPTPMRGKDISLLIATTLLVRALVAWPMKQPGYMDAAYYVDGALGLYEGHGFNLPVIWNYLSSDAATTLPAPSHLYWMPLTSLLIYLSFLVFGPTYRAAQVPSILLSTALPVLAYLVAYRTSLAQAPGRPKRARHHAICAGLLLTFSGFYTAYWVTSDSFALFGIVGGGCLWALGRGWDTDQTHKQTAWFAVAGACAGLAHLTRADGLLFVITVFLAGAATLIRFTARGKAETQALRTLGLLSVFLVCYLIVMTPWFIRNLRFIGRPLSTAGLKTVWLTDYDDLFSYGKPLTVSTYLDWGWSNIVRSKLQALWLNAQTVFFVGWMIALAPLGLLGGWLLRRRVAFRVAGLYGILLYLAMSLVFTFPGWRGGMLHSMVVLLPFLYAAAMEGLDGFVTWVAHRRSTWQPEQAKLVLSAGLILLCIALSAWLYSTNLERYKSPHLYDQVAVWMDQNVAGDTRVLVNDPASFYYHTRRPSLAIPNADLDTVLRVMDHYDATHLLLDANNTSLQALYSAPQSEGRLVQLETFGAEETSAYLFGRAYENP